MEQNNTGFTPESLRLLGAALALQQATRTAANIIPIPNTGRFIAIGTAVEVARLLEIAPAAPASIGVLDTLDAVTGAEIANIESLKGERFYLADDVERLIAQARAARPVPAEIDVRYEFELYKSNLGEAVDYIGDGLYGNIGVNAQAAAFRAGVEVGSRAATPQSQVATYTAGVDQLAPPVEFVQAVAHNFDCYDEVDDERYCRGCSALIVLDGDNDVTRHLSDCIVPRAKAWLAAQAVEAQPDDYDAPLDVFRYTLDKAKQEMQGTVGMFRRSMYAAPVPAQEAAHADDYNSQDPDCSCPSGNGSLRWPCPVHPPEAAQVQQAAAPASERQELDAALRKEVNIMYRLLDDGEWAEHLATTPEGQCLETAITKLIGKANAAAPAGDAEDAARWRALLGTARIRPLGSCGLKTPEAGNYAHLGLELWTVYGRDYSAELVERMDRENAIGIEWLTKFADIAIEAQRAAAAAEQKGAA